MTLPRSSAPERGYDVVIVGAGSAGCILANRLSQDPSRRVLLLEAGREERSIYVRMPAGFPYASSDPRFSWGYSSDAEPHLNGRTVPCPRGRLVGGSSSINAMAFVRGDPADYQLWAKAAGESWNYENCLPAFKSLECFSGGENTYRGGRGELPVIPPTYSNPLFQMFLDACSQAGHPVSPDINGADNEGFGPMDQTISNGVRATAATAFLDPIRNRRNLAIRSGALVTRVLLDNGRATGVEIDENGRRSVIPAAEVILSAGAINSPQILMLSGIGRAADLARVGVKPLIESPDIGQNLQDHIDVSLKQVATEPISGSPLLSPHRKVMIGLEWMLFHTGPGATNHFEVTGNLRTRDDVERPDVQLCFVPFLAAVDGSKIGSGHGYQVSVMLLRPKARGAVTLRSSDPRRAPSILFNYLGHQDDLVNLRNGLRKLRNIVAQAPLARVNGPELAPGPQADSDEALDRFIRETVKSTHHPCGTCRMGLDDASVVDPIGVVRGTTNLRVIDASIMPSITSGNINAPTMMLAEKLGRQMAALDARSH